MVLKSRARKEGLALEGTKEAEFFDKVIIEEAIKDGVGAGRGDSNHVTDQEYQHHCL